MAYKELHLPKEGAIALSKEWGKTNDRGGKNPDKKKPASSKKKPAAKGKK